MIILDTNVISEVMRGPYADPTVLTWLRSLREQPVTTVINRAEILAGLALLPAGAKRDKLVETAERAFSTLGIVLPLVPESASVYAEIVALRRRAGKPIGGIDALIAAIARLAGASIATRDISGFEGLGLELIDPWHPV